MTFIRWSYVGCSHWPAIFNWSNQPKESSGKSITTSSWVFPVLPKMVVPKNHWFSYSKWAFWGVLGVPPFKETSSWFQPIWTNCTSQIGFIFPKDRGENKKIPGNHHLDNHWHSSIFHVWANGWLWFGFRRDPLMKGDLSLLNPKPAGPKPSV